MSRVFARGGFLLQLPIVALMVGLLVSCKPGNDEDSEFKQHVPSEEVWEKRLAIMGATQKDVVTVRFYKGSNGLMYAKTEGADNNELGLVSWAQATITRAKYFKRKGNPTANIHYITPRSGSKKIINFMAVDGNYAIHSAYAYGREPGKSGSMGRPNLKANGRKDSGQGCIRLQDADAKYKGHQYLYKLADEYADKFGGKKDSNGRRVGIPIILDYEPFVSM